MMKKFAGRTLRHMAVLVEDQRLLEAVFVRFRLGQGRIDIGACDLAGAGIMLSSTRCQEEVATRSPSSLAT